LSVLLSLFYIFKNRFASFNEIWYDGRRLSFGKFQMLKKVYGFESTPTYLPITSPASAVRKHGDRESNGLVARIRREAPDYILLLLEYGGTPTYLLLLL
jgi:hypothetical protein